MRIFEKFYLLKANNKSNRMRCGTCSKLTIDIIELNQLVWFYINWLFQGVERLIPLLKIKREIWRQILIAVTLSTLFLNNLMEQIFTLYALNLFTVESVNCLGKEYVQGWKMYFRGFNGIFRKSIQNIPQNSLIFQL